MNIEDGLLFIDGELRAASDGRRFDVISPSDERVVATAAEATVADVAAAVGAARRAFDTTSWGTDHGFRKHCLRQLQSALREHADLFKATQTAEAGIPMCIGGTVDHTIDEMDFSIDMIDDFEWEADFPAHEAFGLRSLRRVRHEPFGVVAAITPWNGPFLGNIWKITPALATGNTVVLKTAPNTPLTGALIGRIVHEQTDIPAGVFNVISSSDNAVGGDALTGDQGVDLFHFTGSTAVGQRILERAAIGIRKTVLELGGKSANILLDDADLDAAVPYSVAMCMLNSGQGCTLATRMIVHESLYDEVVRRLIIAVGQVPVGDPSDPANVVGPIIRASQLDRIAALVERAPAQGARIVAGGHRLDIGGKGFWYAPTLIVDVDENSEIAQTEIFGPVLSVIRYSGGDDEAIRVADNTVYGLSGYIQTRDIERGRRIANRLRTGTVNINNAFYAAPNTPFGGFKRSGLGREHGVEGWKEFLQSKTVAIPAP